MPPPRRRRCQGSSPSSPPARVSCHLLSTCRRHGAGDARDLHHPRHQHVSLVTSCPHAAATAPEMPGIFTILATSTCLLSPLVHMPPPRRRRCQGSSPSSPPARV